MVRYAAILLSSVQCIEGFLMALKFSIIGVRLCLSSQ